MRGTCVRVCVDDGASVSDSRSSVGKADDSGNKRKERDFCRPFVPDLMSTPVLTSISLSCLVPVIYVASLYVWRKRVRDDPTTIRLRFISVTVTTIISLILVKTFVQSNDGRPFCSLIGACFSQTNLFDALFLPILITAILFLGPLVVLRDTYTWEELVQVMREELLDLQSFRNYVVAPITEETIFRGVICAFLSMSFSHKWTILLISSAVFSMAHMHHYFFQSLQGLATMSLAAGLFQMLYTFLFGFYSGTFFLKTGSILTSIALHVFCNFLGFPDVDTLYSRSKYWNATLIGLILWLLICPLYLSSY